MGGSHYPSPPIADVLSFIVSIIQVFGLTAVFMGESIFRFIPFTNRGQVIPEWYYNLKENPLGAMILVFFILPSLAQSFTTSGAFEVSLDGVLIYSKLEMGRMPTVQDIIQALAHQGLHKMQ